MNKLLLSLLLALSSFSQTSNASCPEINGKFDSCKVKSPLLNKLQTFGFNTFLIGYRVELKGNENGYSILTTYKKPFSKRTVLSDDFFLINQTRNVTLESSTNDYPPPELEIHTFCKNNKLVEQINWVNLNTDHYPADYVNKTPKFYKSYWYINNNHQLTRALDIEDKKSYSNKLDYIYAGKITCLQIR